MKKVLLAVAVLIAIVGCSNDNQISVENHAITDVILTFRGETYEVAPGKTLTPPIKNIPNGEYSYSTTWSVNPEAKTNQHGTSLAGTLSFTRSKSSYKMLYSYLISDSTYSVSCNVTTSDPVGGIGKVLAP